MVSSETQVAHFVLVGTHQLDVLASQSWSSLWDDAQFSTALHMSFTVIEYDIRNFEKCNNNLTQWLFNIKLFGRQLGNANLKW